MTPRVFLDGRVILHGVDCLDVTRVMPAAYFDSVVTDPPYALVSITKRFGKAGSAACKVPEGGSGAYARASSGFMGKAWDTGDRAFAVEFWAEVLRALKPGGHVVAFSSTRTYHRLACAIEDAGFEIRDQLAWAYGSGFPKSHNAGNGWGTALKPAWEPIVFARKPLIGTVAANVLAHGTGAINIDGCRVEGGKDVPASPRRAAQGAAYGDLSNDPGTGSGWDRNVGRWPANIVTDGSDEVIAAFPETGASTANDKGPRPAMIEGGRLLPNGGVRGHTDAGGSAARFFYSAKADSNDRIGSKHPTVKPVDLMRWLVRLVTPPGGLVLDPFAGSGTTGEAAFREGMSAVLIEREAEYQADIARRMALAMAGPDERLHATVKARGKMESAGPLFGEVA